MAYIQSYKGQGWLFPPRIEDLIPEDHVCFLVECFVDSLSFSSFDIKYAGAGHPAYHPKILLKLLIMGILDRVRSSRRLAKNARENVVYMYLAEKLAPDFRTISDFRKDNPKLVKEAFKHTVTLAKQEGMLDLSHFSTDGTKVKANASNRRVLTKEELEFLLRFVDEELLAWAKQDIKEDGVFGELRGSDQLPDKIKKRIQKAVRYYVKKLADRGDIFREELAGKLKQAHTESRENVLKQVSTTDPESRFMKNKKGKIELSYNAQITVEQKGFILSADICQQAVDTEQLQPQVLQVEENLGYLPNGIVWSLDNAYFESENIKFLADKKIDGYIPDNEKKKTSPYDKKHFTYDAQKDEYICPTGEPITFSGKCFDKQKNKTIRIYKGESCSECGVRSECTRNKTGIRHIKEFPHEAERAAMRAKMKTPEAKELYAVRGRTVEPVFGDIKENTGLRGFLTRGAETVKTEFNLACIASNLKKIRRYLKGNNKGIPPIESLRHKCTNQIQQCFAS